jgi:hypothetical protein
VLGDRVVVGLLSRGVAGHGAVGPLRGLVVVDRRRVGRAWVCGRWRPAGKRRADAKVPADALKKYAQAGQILVADAAYIGLDYNQATLPVKPYVQGAGGNALYENYWIGISIRKH